MHPPVNYEEFVQTYMDVYNAGGKRSDIAKQLNKTEDAVTQCFSLLRKRGVLLPPLAKKNSLSRSDIDKLNSIVRKSTDARIDKR